MFLAVAAHAQTGELTLDKGVAPHKQIDSIYARFSDSYRTLDASKVTALYTETVAYLPPDSPILYGRGEVAPTFKSFFESVASEGRTMTISFRIHQRRADKKMAYDVGVYTIRQFKDGKEVGTGSGKFVTVAVREKDGQWRFQVDGYSGLTPPTR